MYPRVREIVHSYLLGNLHLVNFYLNQPGMEVYPDSWSGNIKKLLDKKMFDTAINEIELVAYKFKISENEKTKDRTN